MVTVIQDPPIREKWGSSKRRPPGLLEELAPGLEDNIPWALHSEQEAEDESGPAPPSLASVATSVSWDQSPAHRYRRDGGTHCRLKRGAACAWLSRCPTCRGACHRGSEGFLGQGSIFVPIPPNVPREPGFSPQKMDTRGPALSNDFRPRCQ